MFDKIRMKPKFYAKCKSHLKMTKMRLGAIMKKRKAVEKYLKNDVADLLKNGLDYNAYGRAEGLWIEQNRTACYVFVLQFCDCIPKTLLSVMQKQRECPEECREAVSSLMYAAARFADLPELRDLRTLFTDKYGNSLDYFLNKEFAEKLRADPPTKEMKIQLMHNIAKEISIEWDPKALEQKLFVPPPSEKDVAWNHPSSDAGYKSHGGSNEDDVSGTDRTVSTDRDLWETSSSSVGSASEDDEKKKHLDYRSIPAPCVRPKVSNEASRVEESTYPSVIAEAKNSKQDNTVVDTKQKPRSVRRRPSRLQSDRDTNDSARFDASLVSPGARLPSPGARLPSPGAKLPPKLTVDVEKMIDGTANTKYDNLGSGPARAGSLPVESTTSHRAKQAPPSRAPSMSPEMHVHPRLPDYDDLATRVAALQGI